MQETQASAVRSDIVRDIVLKSIMSVYPCYYPKGAVDFFVAHHYDGSILEDMQ